MYKFYSEWYDFFENHYYSDAHRSDCWDHVSTIMFERQIGHALINAYDILLTSSTENSVNSLLYHNVIEWTYDSWG